MHGAPEVVLTLAPAQSAHSKSARITLGQLIRAHPSQVGLQAALHDGENALLVVSPVGCDAPVQPADRSVHRFLHARSRRGRFHHIVQLHHYVRPDRVLDLHAAFRCQHTLATVVRTLEPYALLGDFGQLQQRHHLEATGIGQQRSRPTHELVQTARLFQHVRPGAHSQVVGVAEHYAAVQLEQLLRQYALQRALRSDRHEDRRVDVRVTYAHHTDPRFRHTALCRHAVHQGRRRPPVGCVVRGRHPSVGYFRLHAGGFFADVKQPDGQLRTRGEQGFYCAQRKHAIEPAI
uniref:Uncharacterized protein n=1 Tax=Anopheles dirus TaxID=7168 RepID=A0A182N6C0_9DIPT